MDGIKATTKRNNRRIFRDDSWHIHGEWGEGKPILKNIHTAYNVNVKISY